MLYENKDLTKEDILHSHSFSKSNLYVGTIHSAKGLEFDSVFVYDVDSSSFKIHSSVETENVYYVACTRAKNHLYIVKSL